MSKTNGSNENENEFLYGAPPVEIDVTMYTDVLIASASPDGTEIRFSETAESKD